MVYKHLCWKIVICRRQNENLAKFWQVWTGNFYRQIFSQPVAFVPENAGCRRYLWII